MALTNDALWFMQPFQIFSTLGSAANFGTYAPADPRNSHSTRVDMLIGYQTGGSVLQSPLILPMLWMPEVPVKYAGQQTTYLLHYRYVAPVHPAQRCQHHIDMSQEGARDIACANPRAIVTEQLTRLCG
jgi:hypothetical protein